MMHFVPITIIWLFIISIMDIRKRKVPVWALLAGGILALITCIYQQSGYLDILGGMFPGMLLLFVAFVTQKAGYGDGIVLLFLGMMAGAGKCFLIFGGSLFLAAGVSAVLLMLKKAGRNTGIPFLPFLAVAWSIVML